MSREAQQPNNQVMFASLARIESMHQAFLDDHILYILSNFAYSCNVYTTIAS